MPLWQIYDDPVILTFGSIVFRELLPEPAGLNSNRAVVPWVVRGRPAERFHCDGVLFEMQRFPGDMLVCQEFQKVSKDS